MVGLFTMVGAEEFRFKPPVNLGPPVNTTWSEEDPFITADGQRLFFVSDRNFPHNSMDIFMSVWTGTNWSEPIDLGPNVNSGSHEWSPSVSPDGKKLYFTAFGRPGSIGGWDIWSSTWDSVQQQWGLAQNLGPVINSSAVDWTSDISYNGQSLYYATNGKGHIQGQALYVSHWNGTSWGTPVPFPDNINNTATEARPSLTVDERTMYFVRWGDYMEIYVTQKNFDNTWSNPVKLDSMINTPGGNSGPYVIPDGKKLFFASARSGGVGGPGTADIWVAERIIAEKIPALKKKLLLVLILVLMAGGLLLIKTLKP